MSVQRPTDETVTTGGQAQIDDVVLERRSWNYAYIGEDAKGRHHHLDRKRERVVVTKSRADRDDDGAVPVFALEGPILHVEDVSEHDQADGTTDGVVIWIGFIGAECGDDESGWAHRPVSAADKITDALEEVF
ncbi:hypothetical protein [Natronobacterium gregoryi]|uniref:Uncharacterized protein n=2 Tax=Natronobacterium gregoryi TaxID=44930 RepID=L0ALD0_NATGS|nr:hypothetical protein [Natronobacterium gregoryi]AFZ74586.1 hypothetical protein Natgr_3467 [Natronobacterium gregoryi SP2]ELY72590.1 hypothetical protein C490_03338 [Natronobacterium gregoryi SP2]PLK19776.1 hypothetical protein CYV19_12775 [Natronobacterium gregoryi SP2]SFJ29979.1 hypothetical protein SAMN05443661_1214 [Natronobacterium gregoryi]